MEYGQKKVALSRTISLKRNLVRGYYLITPSGAYFISRTNDFDAFEKVCEARLKKSEGYQYTVDFCHGQNNAGRHLFENADLTDRFI